MASVLIVDDDPDTVLLARLILEMAGHDVTTAASGPAALDVVERLDVEVVLLDVRMPGMDGREVLRELADRGVLAHTAVVVFSAHADPALAAETEALGSRAFLAKPFRRDDLLRVVASVL